MIVDDCLSRVREALEKMRADHDRVRGSFRIEMESMRRKTRVQPLRNSSIEE